MSDRLEGALVTLEPVTLDKIKGLYDRLQIDGLQGHGAHQAC